MKCAVASVHRQLRDLPIVTLPFRNKKRSQEGGVPSSVRKPVIVSSCSGNYRYTMNQSWGYNVVINKVFIQFYK